MRKNFGAKTWLYPMPVLIVAAYDEKGRPNAMNAAWGGISEEHQLSVCISPEHKTTANILSSSAFTVSVATADTAAACDYVGIVSGNEVPNKMEAVGFHTERSSFVNAPIICELPMTLECRLINYDENTCILVGDIVNVSADERILDEKGRIDVERLSPITYDSVHHLYRKLGDAVAPAFKAGLQYKN